MAVPNDPIMLLSYINTRLRDSYPSLSALCDAEDIDMASINDKLEAIGYSYNADLNQYK